MSGKVIPRQIGKLQMRFSKLMLGLTGMSNDLPVKSKAQLAPSYKANITNYLHNFLKGFRNNFQSIGIGEVIIVPFTNGVIVEFNRGNLPKDKAYAVNEKLIFYPIKESIMEAAEELGLQIDNFLRDDLVVEFNDPATDKDNFFEGTNIFYSSDKFYIIKSHSENLWNTAAIKNDIIRILADAKKIKNNTKTLVTA